MRVFEIYRRLAGQVDATVLTGNFPGARCETLDGVRYRRLGASSPYPWSRWTYAGAATRLLARAPYDAAVYDFSVYTPLRLPRNRPVGLVVHMLHGPTAEDRWGHILASGVRRYERTLLRQAQWISTTSRWMEEQLKPLVLPTARIVLIGSGVPDEFARVSRREADYLLYYGRFDFFQKGLDTLLSAFARIASVTPIELRVAGEGKDEAQPISEPGICALTGGCASSPGSNGRRCRPLSGALVPGRCCRASRGPPDGPRRGHGCRGSGWSPPPSGPSQKW